MGKMNYERANKIQRTGKAQSEHADADHPPGITPENIYRSPKAKPVDSELERQRSQEETQNRNAKRAEFLKNKEQLLEEYREILGCKPDCSDAYIQLQKLIKENPDEKSKYWLAYHRLNEIVNTFY
jgi:hypothetical protein